MTEQIIDLDQSDLSIVFDDCHSDSNIKKATTNVVARGALDIQNQVLIP